MYQLFISQKEEIIRTPSDTVKKLPLLGVTGEFFKVYRNLKNKGAKPEEIGSALFMKFINSIDEHPPITSLETELWSSPFNHIEISQKKIPEEMPFEKDKFYAPLGFSLIREDDWIWFLLEHNSLKMAIRKWLEPKGKGRGKYKPRELFLQNTLQIPGDIENDGNNWKMYFSYNNVCIDGSNHTKIMMYLYEVFRYRTRNVGMELIAVDNKLYNIFCSNNLLSLAWSEIMWSIENNRFASICKICGCPFALGDENGRNQRNRNTCCSKECIKQWKIRSMGGKESYNKYFRELMRNRRNNKKDKKIE